MNQPKMRILTKARKASDTCNGPVPDLLTMSFNIDFDWLKSLLVFIAEDEDTVPPTPPYQPAPKRRTVQPDLTCSASSAVQRLQFDQNVAPPIQPIAAPGGSVSRLSIFWPN